jgi:2-methylcitrate dehydratase PrpD
MHDRGVDDRGIARQWARESAAGQLVGIWPGADRGPLTSSVFANATSANAFDLDDGYRLAKGHPGACVVPAALAAAEARPSTTGEELAAVIVIGYEVAMRARAASSTRSMPTTTAREAGARSVPPRPCPGWLAGTPRP